MERHPVPHNFMDVDFKLFGFFTVKQFGYLAVGFILSLLFYYTEIPEILKYIFIGVSMGAGIFLAIVKINGQPSSVWLQNFITSMFDPQERLWRKTPVVPDILKETTVSKKVVQDPPNNILNRARVAAIQDRPLESLSSEEQELDKDEKVEFQKINEHFDFLFNTIPEIKGEKVIENTSEEPLEQKMLIKKPVTIAESVHPEYSQEKLYSTSDYAVAYRPLKNQGQRPIDLSDKIIQVSGPDEINVTNPKNPNFFEGVVKSFNGSPIPNARVEIVDLSGKMVRSLTTDKDGRFGLSSKLPEGDYYIDVSNTNFNFERISVNILSDKLSNITIVSKS